MFDVKGTLPATKNSAGFVHKRLQGKALTNCVLMIRQGKLVCSYTAVMERVSSTLATSVIQKKLRTVMGVVRV
jgi:hypothetical protein